MAHTGKNIANSVVSAKDAVIRKFLGKNDEIIAKYGSNVERFQKNGVVQNIRNELADLDERDLQILKKTTTQEYDKWIQTAQKALNDNYSQTPYHQGAKQANEVMDILEENIRKNQIERMEIISNSGIEKIEMKSVSDDIYKDLKKSFNIEKGVDGEWGAVTGRRSMIDATNQKDLKALEILQDALKTQSPAELMDNVKILQNMLYDSSQGLRVSDPMKNFMKRATGKINTTLKEAMGPKYAKILEEMADDIKLQDDIKRIFKPGIGDEVTNRGELAMKRLSNGTTTSSEVRDLALKIQEKTGVDLIKTSRLAQLSMDIVGDKRGNTLFGVINDVKDGLASGIWKNTKKALVNKQSTARANTINTDGGKYLKNGTYKKTQTGFVSKFRENQKPLREITSKKEKVFLSNFEQIKSGKHKLGVVAEGIVDKNGKTDYLYMRKDYLDEAINKHGEFLPENLIITAKDAEYILQSKNGKSYNYIKQVAPNEFLLLATRKATQGKSFITHFPIESENITYIQKLKKDMNIIKSPGLPTTTEGLGRHIANQGDFIGNSISKNQKNANISPKSYTNRNLDAPIISQKEAKAIVRKYFKDDQVAVKLADRIVANDGVEAFGMYHKKMIAFAKNPTKYTPEHEVFHAYFDMALKPKEKNAILKAIQKQENFKTKLDAEEFMADAFAEFVVGRRERSKNITGKLKNIFDDLAYIFKEFFGKSDKVEKLYRELESVGRGKRGIVMKGGDGGVRFLKNSNDVSEHKFGKKLTLKDKNSVFFNRRSDREGNPIFVSDNTYYIGKAKAKKNDFVLSELVKGNSAGGDFYYKSYKPEDTPNAVKFSWKEGIEKAYYDRKENRIFLPGTETSFWGNPKDLNVGIYDYYKQKYGGITLEDFKKLPDNSTPNKKSEGRELLLKYLQKAQENSDEAKDFSQGYYNAWKRDLEHIENSNWYGRRAEEEMGILRKNIAKVDNFYEKKGLNIERAVGQSNKYGIRPIISLDSSGLPVIYFETPKGQLSFHIPQYTDFDYLDNVSKLKEYLPEKILKNVDLVDNYKWSGKTDTRDIINSLTVDDFIETRKTPKVIKADNGAKFLKNSSRKFDESFRKISDRQFEKMKTAIKNKEFYGIKSQPSQKLLQDLKKIGITQEVKTQRISSDGIIHILKGHGPNSGDKIPVTMEDIRHIPEIQNNYDNIFLSPKLNNNGQKVIIYEKKIGEYYYYLERITEGGMLDTQTMYINPIKKNFK